MYDSICFSSPKFLIQIQGPMNSNPRCSIGRLNALCKDCMCDDISVYNMLRNLDPHLGDSKDGFRNLGEWTPLTGILGARIPKLISQRIPFIPN